METYRILTINPGSTSTKIAVFAGEKPMFTQSITHHSGELAEFVKVVDQYQYRLNLVKEVLLIHDIPLKSLQAIVGRGGVLGPMPSGTYQIDRLMLDALYNAPVEHASNLGGIIAYNLGKELGIPAFVVDPVSVDEMLPEARLSGLKEIPRLSQGHALNTKAVARKAARKLGKGYEELNLLVAHLGSGISVTPHRGGKMLDINNANNEGPFSPERAGGLPASLLIKLCFSGKYSEDEVLTKLTKQGGFFSYLGTKDSREVEEMALKGDQEASLVLAAFIHQVAKEIGAMATVLYGQVDTIVLTGGIAHSKYITEEISKRVSFIAPVTVIPGEEELEALALGALRVLKGEEDAVSYGEVRREF